MELRADDLGAPAGSGRRLPLLNALRCLGALSLAIVALATTTPTVNAYGTPIACGARYERAVFGPWGDTNNYFRISNGGFESGATDWQLANGAAVVDGNEPWKVASYTDGHSLRMPAGSTAESRTICVAMSEDSIRLFVSNSRVSGSILHVEAWVRNPLNGQMASTTFDVNGDASPLGWSPTMRLKIPNLLGGTTGTQQLYLSFSTRGTPATWTIDDVYVDPLKSF